MKKVKTKKFRSRVLTVQMLRDKGACLDVIRLFKRHFGTKASVSLTLARKKRRVFGRYTFWLLEHMLDKPMRHNYSGVNCQLCSIDEDGKGLEKWAARFIAERKV